MNDDQQRDAYNPDRVDGKPVPDPFAYDLFEICLIAVCLLLAVIALVMSSM